MYLIIIMKGKKQQFLFLFPMIYQLKKKCAKKMNVKVNFCDMTNLIRINDIYYKEDSKNYAFIKK